MSKGRGKRSKIPIASNKSNDTQREVADISSAETSKAVPKTTEDGDSTELDIHGNIRTSGVSTSKSIIDMPPTSEDSDKDITDTELVQVAVKSKNI